jgi:hypothetical protein
MHLILSPESQTEGWMSKEFIWADPALQFFSTDVAQFEDCSHIIILINLLGHLLMEILAILLIVSW